MLEHKDWDLPVIPAKAKRSRRQRREDRKSGLAAIFGDDKDDLYERLQEYREDGWRKTLLAFEANPDSPYNAYYYVANHPMFYSFKPWKNAQDGVPAVHERHLDHESGWTYVHIDPHMVNPVDNKISDDPHLNTKLEWWYEFGPTLFHENMGAGVSGHDHHCDGGADTYDEAIIKVAKAIHEAYGNDRKQVMEKWNDPELPTEG